MYKIQVIYLKTVIQSDFAAQLCHSEYQILYALNHTYLPTEKTVVCVCVCVYVECVCVSFVHYAAACVVSLWLPKYSKKRNTEREVFC